MAYASRLCPFWQEPQRPKNGWQMKSIELDADLCLLSRRHLCLGHKLGAACHPQVAPYLCRIALLALGPLPERRAPCLALQIWLCACQNMTA